MVYVTINTHEVDNLVQRLAEEPAWNLDPAERGQLAAVLSTMHRLLENPAAVAENVDSDATGSFSISVAVEEADLDSDLFSASFVPSHGSDGAAAAVKIGGPGGPANADSPAVKIGGPGGPANADSPAVKIGGPGGPTNTDSPAVKIGGPGGPTNTDRSAAAVKIGGPSRPTNTDSPAVKIGGPNRPTNTDSPAVKIGGPGADGSGRA